MQIRFKNKIDMTAMNTYTMDVLIDGASLTGGQTNQLALKLQDATEAEPWTNQNVVTQAITPDVWTTVSFAFNDDASMARTDVDNIVIQFNGEGNNDSVTGYIKNVVGSYTRQPLDLNSDGKVDVLDIVFAFNNNHIKGIFFMLLASLFFAVNDFVVQNETSFRVTSLSLFIDNQHVSDYKSDGIIISTPTGSTAYSLSSGGPIVQPDVFSIVILSLIHISEPTRPY